ncbi:MAG TPA: hypothetical protein VMG32_12820, partial [Anaeromyxobacteraceae bacterium]|nr:hypothetical protein [Anaeromyxobacteraceae bacterium]
SASVPPKGSATFTASGGIGTGFTWSLATNASGGSIDASTGAYTAGATGSVADVVKVTDSLGNAGTTSVTVTAGVTVSPAVQTVTTGATTSFKASGGSGTGFTFSLAMNASRGSIDAVNGNYRAGTQTGTDVVEATDSLGNVGTAQVTVVAAPSGGGCGYDGGGGLWLSLLALAAVRWLRALSRTKDHATA